jgi:hypothetical protein
MSAPMPFRKPDEFRSPFAPILSSRANNKRVIETILAHYLESRAKNDSVSIRLRRFLKRANHLFQAAPRTTTLHSAIRGGTTIFWAHEKTLAPNMEVSVSLPTSVTFLTMRKDMK